MIAHTKNAKGNCANTYEMRTMCPGTCVMRKHTYIHDAGGAQEREDQVRRENGGAGFVVTRKRRERERDLSSFEPRDINCQSQQQERYLH